MPADQPVVPQRADPETRQAAGTLGASYPDLGTVFPQFDPQEPLDADDPRYVDTLEERHARALFARLTLRLTNKTPQALLFTGHIGDGKTTILHRLRERLEAEEPQGWFVAFGEAGDYLNLSDAEHDDVLIAILAIADQALRARFKPGS